MIGAERADIPYPITCCPYSLATIVTCLTQGIPAGHLLPEAVVQLFLEWDQPADAEWGPDARATASPI